jgi:hypothetical protein
MPWFDSTIDWFTKFEVRTALRRLCWLSTTVSGSRGNSVSIVPGNGLNDRAIEVRSPAEAKRIFFSSLCVQTGSGAHPASCAMGTGGPSPELKRGRGVTLTTHPDLVPRSRMSRSFTSSPPAPPYVCSGTGFSTTVS